MSFSCWEPATRSNSTPRRRRYESKRNLGSSAAPFIAPKKLRKPRSAAARPGTAFMLCFHRDGADVGVCSGAEKEGAAGRDDSAETKPVEGRSKRRMGNAGIPWR